MYPGPNNYNNQYPNYQNQQNAPGGASIGFNVGQTGYVAGQADFNVQSQGFSQQYIPGVPNTVMGQPCQAQYFQQQQPISNPATSWNPNPQMGQYPYGGACQPMNPVAYGGQNPQIGQQYPPSFGGPYQPVSSQQNPPVIGGSVQPGSQQYHPEHVAAVHVNANQPHGGSGQNIRQEIGNVGVGYIPEVFRGTIRPQPNFDAEQDCKVLKTAMKGIGTDEKAIIECLGRRNLDQRLAIKKTYKTMYGKDLIDSLKSELSGDFSRAVVESLYDSDYYDAHSLHQAMAGAGTREAVLTEILTSRSNEEIENIKVLYKKWFKDDLEKRVISETSGFYKRVLVSCLQANKKELTADEYQKLRQFGPSAVVNVNQASQEAAELYNAGEKKLGTDEAVFIKIFAMRNKYQLRATFDAYQKLSGHNIVKAIENEMSGDLQSALKAIASQVQNEPLYFANRLFKAMKGAGTTDSTLIRVLLTRSEIDLDNIKKEFQKQYNKSLAQFVSEDTSGDYNKFLLRFVEGN